MILNQCLIDVYFEGGELIRDFLKYNTSCYIYYEISEYTHIISWCLGDIKHEVYRNGKIEYYNYLDDNIYLNKIVQQKNNRFKVGVLSEYCIVKRDVFRR